MKKLFLLLGALILSAGIVNAESRYETRTSTKSQNVAYSARGSMKFEFCASTSATPTVVISSSGVQMPTAAGSCTGAGTGSGLDADKLDGYEAANFALSSATVATGDAIKKTYTQTAHGILAGRAIYYNGTSWKMAQADSVATADALGITDSVGVDTFSVVMQGYISNVSGVSWTAGSVYYISATSSGTLTTTEPTTYGYVSKPMLFALGTSSGIVVNMRGVVVTQTGVYDGVPVGSVVLHSTTTPPTDFLYCNGQAVSRTTYSNLFTVIGTRYGVGDNSTTFNVPDMRGLFARGLDDGKGNDPDSSFRVIGSTQSDAFQGHYHYEVEDPSLGMAAGSNERKCGRRSISSGFEEQTAAWGCGNPVEDATHGTPRTGLETRPENMAWAYMIKYRTNISTASGILDIQNTFTQKQTVPALTVTGSTTTVGNLTANTLYSNNMIKGYVAFNGSTMEILDSFNVSSITDNNTGDWTVNWIIPFASANYMAIAGTSEYRIAGVQTVTASTVKIRVYVGTGFGDNDATYVTLTACGRQ